MKVTSTQIEWNPELSIYASEPFLRAVGNEYGWLGGFDDSGALCCILPYTIIRKAMVRMVRFRIETIPLREDFSIEEERSFLNGVVDYFRRIGADIIIPATTNAIFRTYPQGADVAPYGTHIIDLQQSVETIFANFSSSHRRKVRLALKKGVEIRSGIDQLNFAYELVRDTFKRSKMSFMNSENFKRYVLSLNSNVKIFGAYYKDSIQGCIVIPFSLHTAYYVYGGSISNPKTGSTNLLHWEAIKYFSNQGVKRYDFCGVRINPEKGSKQEGLMMYKERFGPKLYQGYMWKYPLNPLKSSVYTLAVRLLRGGDIVDAERHKLPND